MKKLLTISLIFLLCFLNIGCTDIKNQTSNTKSSTTSTKDAQDSLDKNNYKILGTFEELKNTVDCNGSNNMFITENGDLFAIGNFSDGSNIKKLNDGIKFSRFNGHLDAVLSEQGDWYEINNFMLSAVTRYESETIDSTIIESDYSDSYISYGRISVIAKNKDIFIRKINMYPYTIVSETLIHQFTNSEKFERIINAHMGTIIVTNTSRYKIKKTTNKSKYDDIPDTYSYKLEKLPEYKDNIAFEKFHIKIDKNGCVREYEFINF